MMALALRPLKMTDLAKVAALGEACAISWPLPHLEHLVREPRALCRVAESGGQIVGALTAQLVPDEAELLDVAVHPQYRRQRIGHALMTELFTAAAVRRIPRVICEVAVDNDAALQLYRSLGFVEVALRPAYFSNPARTERSSAAPVDARLMERRLS